MAVQPREDKTGLGIAIMALAVVMFTCIDTSAKWLIGAGIGALQVVFCRYSVAFLVSLIVYVPRNGIDVFKTKHPILQFIRALFLLGSTVFNFSALKFLPVTLTTTIMFASPIVITLLSIPMLGEKVGLRRILAVLVGFLGVFYVVQPWGADFHPAVFLSLGALICASLYFIMTRMIAGVEDSATSQVWANGIAAISLAPFVLPHWTMPVDIQVAFILTLIGIFGATGHILATRAHRLADASILAPLVYTQIITIPIASYIVFLQLPAQSTLIGGAIVIGSGLYIWQRERRLGSPKA